MNNQRRTTIFTLRYYAIGCVFVFSDDVLITMRSPEHPRARRHTPEQTDNWAYKYPAGDAVGRPAGW